MRILFIKPNMGLVDGRPYFDRGRMEPLTFAVLKGMTPPPHEVHLCDDRFESVPYSQPWDLVGINTEIYTARRAYEIADRFRSQGVKVVLGGYHTTLIPGEAAEHADAIRNHGLPILAIEVSRTRQRRVQAIGRVHPTHPRLEPSAHKTTFIPRTMLSLSRTARG